jgi:hypothetical protein
VRTYPSHSSILYTLHLKHAGCEYPNDTSRRERFQASTTVCGHSIRFRSNTCGQIRAAEPSEKVLIGGADPRCRSRAEWIRIMEIKIEKGAILSQYPPTNGPCPHGLTARSSSSGRLFASSRRISPFRSIGMSSIEIHFKVKVLVAFIQDLGPFVGIDIVSILPCIMLFQKPVPPNLKLESISEPSSVDVLLHDPEVLIVDLHRWWSQFPPMWDRIGNGFGKDIDMKYIMNFPLRGQGESIREV